MNKLALTALIACIPLVGKCEPAKEHRPQVNPPTAEMQLKKFDKDGDQKLDINELKAMFAAHREHMAQREANKPPQAPKGEKPQGGHRGQGGQGKR